MTVHDQGAVQPKDIDEGEYKEDSGRSESLRKETLTTRTPLSKGVAFHPLN